METKRMWGKAVIIVALFLAYSELVFAYPNWNIYSDANIYDGDEYGLVNVYDTLPNHTTVNMYGGLCDYIGTHDSSILNVFDGQTEVQAKDTSIINISGGDISLALAWQYGEINISGSANINGLSARDFCMINIKGGAISGTGARNSGIINIYGGELTEGIYATDNSWINVYGHDLIKTYSGGYYGYGQLYGYLEDETYICVDIFDLETHDHINLIPEPATFILLALAVPFIRRKNQNE